MMRRPALKAEDASHGMVTYVPRATVFCGGFPQVANQAPLRRFSALKPDRHEGALAESIRQARDLELFA